VQVVTILVKSSSRPEPYAIEVVLKDSRVSLFCDCPAGRLGKYCKHKEAVVFGDDSILFDEAQRDKFEVAVPAISSTALPSLFAELREANQALGIAKKQVTSLKAKIVRSLSDGIE
jgi:uncharacterized Zn finger protein